MNRIFRLSILSCLIITVIMILVSFNFQSGSAVFVDKNEAMQAFNYLRQIRENPTRYCRQLGFDSTLRVSKNKLVWNDLLATVAEAKAYDMASRNYLAHVTPEGYGINFMMNQKGYALIPEWLKDKKDNFFESIAGGAMDGRNMIDILIIDKDEPGFGHRKHLLGTGKFQSNLVDIGIGFARVDSGATYSTYASIIIAKHTW